MKKFILVVCAVLLVIGVLAACAPITSIEDGIQDITSSITDRAIPTWVIIVGAVIVFLICFGIIWKLIPGFVKFIVLLVVAGAIAGAAYGLWTIPAYDKAKEIYDDVTDVIETQQTEQAD